MLRNNERSPQRAILCGFSRLGSVARARFPTVCGKKKGADDHTERRDWIESLSFRERPFPQSLSVRKRGKFHKKKTAFPFGSAENIFFQTLTACNLTLLRETPL